MTVAVMVFLLSTACPVLGYGEPVHFAARDLEDQSANWSPQEVTLSGKGNSGDAVMFVLENTTGRTHVFEAPGLLMKGEGRDTAIIQPLRVTVAAGDSLEVRVFFSQETGDANGCADNEACYRFYCPLHRADGDPGGIIRIVR